MRHAELKETDDSLLQLAATKLFSKSTVVTLSGTQRAKFWAVSNFL